MVCPPQRAVPRVRVAARVPPHSTIRADQDSRTPPVATTIGAVAVAAAPAAPVATRRTPAAVARVEWAEAERHRRSRVARCCMRVAVAVVEVLRVHRVVLPSQVVPVAPAVVEPVERRPTPQGLAVLRPMVWLAPMLVAVVVAVRGTAIHPEHRAVVATEARESSSFAIRRSPARQSSLRLLRTSRRWSSTSTHPP